MTCRYKSVVSDKKGLNNYSRTRRTPRTDHNMWWHFLNEHGQIVILRFHLSTATKASFLTKQNEWHVQFSSYSTKIPNHKTPSCLTTCVVYFVNRIFFSSGCKCSSFAAIRTDNADMSILWACRNDDFLGDISVLPSISSS